MANGETAASTSALDVKNLLAELEVPFPPDQVRWRVTNTDKRQEARVKSCPTPIPALTLTG